MLLLVICLLALFVPAVSFAAGGERHAIDTWLDKALTGKTSTPDIASTIDAGTKKWDAELNKQYKALMARLAPEGQAALKTAQRAWIKYRDAEIEASIMIYNTTNGGGTMMKLDCASRQYDITKARALELSEYNRQ